MDEYPLYEDVKAIDRIGAALVPVNDRAPERPDVAAIEEGQRYHPDGVVEDYRRVEFRQPE